MTTVNEYLQSMLEKYNLTDKMKREVQGKRELIEKKLRAEYGNRIVTIMYSGSYGKDTAVNLDYDLDLIVYFKHSAFDTLREMYGSVYSILLQSNFGFVREQRVSIGIDLGSFHIDVVPARIIGDDSSRDANLYNKETGSNIKTNIKTHIDYIRKAQCRSAIKLMKVWKKLNGVPIKSFALELIVIRALRNYGNTDLETQFYRALEYIRDSIDTIQLIDPANENNVLTDTMNFLDRGIIRSHAIRAISAYDLRSVIW